MPIEDFQNDCALLNLLKQDSREAFALIYRRYWEDLYATAMQRLKNSQQAEDIVQDVFVSVWCRRNNLTIKNLPAYLHTAVRFKIFNYVSRNLAGEAFFEPFEAIAAYQTAADDHLLGKEMMHLIRLYADTLPEKRKQIFLLHLSENYSTHQIAELLHIKPKTVQNQLGRALGELKTRIASLGIFGVWCFCCLPL